MTTMNSNYTLKNFSELTNDGFSITLEQSYIDNINKVIKQMGLTTFIETPIYTKQPKKSPSSLSFSNNQNNQNNQTTMVNTIFKTTKIEHKSGLDVIINSIKLNLNKLSDKKYNDIKQQIVDYITEECGTISDDDKKKVVHTIYSITSSNKFHSLIYAKIFSELSLLFEWIKEEFMNNIYPNIMDNYNNIIYVNPDDDYDKYCDINKQNEKRRSLSQFLVNLSNLDYISKESVINILHTLVKRLDEQKSQDNNKFINDEIAENISNLYNSTLLDNTENMQVKYIIETVELFAILKPKDYKGLTNKTIFKFMDLLE